MVGPGEMGCGGLNALPLSAPTRYWQAEMEAGRIRGLGLRLSSHGKSAI